MSKSEFRIPNPIHSIGKWLARRELSALKKYEPYKPNIEGCKGWNGAPAPYGFHQWEWDTSWNGNNSRVLPFLDKSWTHGIARAGHRCYRCGEFRWRETDEQYALELAFHLGYLPGVKTFLKTGEWPVARTKAVTEAA